MANDLLRGRQTVVPLTNKSGGGVVAGDVVMIDTGNDAAFTTTTTGQVERSVGIAQETIANNAVGRVLTHGYAALVNVPSSVTRGHYIQTHTVAKQAVGNSTRQAGSFGQFLTGGTTPTAVLWGAPDQTAAGGSGDSTTQAAFGSRPAAGNDGNLFFPTDGYSIGRDDGAAWDNYGPLFPLVAPPAVAGWTAINSASASDDRGGIVLTCPAGTGNNVRAMVLSAPSTPYTITAAMLLAMPAVDFNSAGLCFRQSSDGKMVMYSLCNAAKVFAGIKMTSATSYSGANYAIAFTSAAHMGPLFWLRIADNGTNRIVSWSPDGRNWVVMHTVGRTDFLTADQVGFCGESVNSGFGPIVNLLSWEVG